MLMTKTWRWLPAAALLPLMLAACTGGPARPGHGTGPAGRAASPAYRDGGLIVITFDEGSDPAACCGETSGLSPSHPDVPLPGKSGPGGGRVGAVLLSPLIRPGTSSTTNHNHYSLLRTVEDIFGLPHLGDAAMPQVKPFGPDIFGDGSQRQAGSRRRHSPPADAAMTRPPARAPGSGRVGGQQPSEAP